MIEYEDLLEQLKQFRLDVINALSEIEAEQEASAKTLLRLGVVSEQEYGKTRAAAQLRLSKLREYNAQRLTLLHERRGDR